MRWATLAGASSSDLFVSSARDGTIYRHAGLTGILKEEYTRSRRVGSAAGFDFRSDNSSLYLTGPHTGQTIASYKVETNGSATFASYFTDTSSTGPDTQG